MAKVVYFDTETVAFRPGLKAPPVVCVQYAIDGGPPQLVHWKDAEPLLCEWLSDDSILVGQNVAYDMACICHTWPHLINAVFAKYHRGEVTDTMLRQQLVDIEDGVFKGYPDAEGNWKRHGYSLAELAHRLCGKSKDAKDPWRTRYGELIDIPVALWPEAAIKYALNDAEVTRAVYLAQRDTPDERRQARYAFALHLSSVWGLKTNPDLVHSLQEAVNRRRAELFPILLDAGLIRGSGQKNMAAVRARIAYLDPSPRMTKDTNKHRKTPHKPQIATDAKYCRELDDPLLAAYADYSELGSVEAKDIPVLTEATRVPVHTRYGIADSGRTTSSSPNVQNWRSLPGIREAFEPREGYVFVQADYGGMELVTLAQTCLRVVGYSRLAEQLNAGIDPHLSFACRLMGIPYEEGVRRKKDKDVDHHRKLSKVFSFGKPGGLGIPKLCMLAKVQYKVDMSEAEARGYQDKWFEEFPEMRAYFRWVEAQKQHDETYSLVTYPSGRKRGGCTYTAACNHGFQAPGSDLAKLGLWLVTVACYTQPDSPLFGSRVVAFVHDEIILETPRGKAFAAAPELERLMVRAAGVICPDVKISAPPLVMKYWSKKAEWLGDGLVWGDYSRTRRAAPRGGE